MSNKIWSSLTLIILSVLLVGCSTNNYHEVDWKINTKGQTITDRINAPKGYEIIQYPKDSFESYIQNLKVKKDGSKIYLYDGSKLLLQGFHVAIIDLDVGDLDLQQCADAIIRIRAEYLYKTKQYNKIAFHLTNGYLFKYSDYRAGYRLQEENNVTWIKKEANRDHSYQAFRNYLDDVFSYAGTLSLPLETKETTVFKIKPGDFFVVDNHALFVVGVAVNKDNNDRLFLLAQSSSPAQSIHVLKNPNSNSPWYFVKDFNYPFSTPTWTFKEQTTLRTY